jgi:hypothetical protein
MALSATLPLRPDAERARLRLGTAFIEHAGDLWLRASLPRRPNGSGRTSTTSWRAGTDAWPRRQCASLPHRLHWVPWLLAELEPGVPLDG